MNPIIKSDGRFEFTLTGVMPAAGTLRAEYSDDLTQWKPLNMPAVISLPATLNIGPMPSGDIAPGQAGLLRQMGLWLRKAGESIYGMRGGPFKPGEYGISTRKGNVVYVHVLKWLDQTLRLPPLAATVIRSRVLTGGNAQVRQSQAGLEISVPEPDRQPLDTIVALELDRPAL